MPHETFTGDAIAPLLRQAREALGPDAQVVRVNRLGNRYTLVVSTEAEAAPAPAPAPASAPDFRATLDSRLRGIPEEPLPARPRGRPLVVALVGPTGAGKTTTAAKLAMSRHAFGGREIGLIGLDTYRVGAVEQLALWAEVARVPMEVAWGPNDTRAALRRFRSCDAVLVDTPGRGPGNAADLDAVRQTLAALRPDETHLVLPVGRIWRVVRQTLRDYRAFGITHLLASKVDECADDWGVFELALAEGLPMRWIADGQAVPDALRPAADRLAGAALRRPRAVTEVA
ncbi:MAG: hypothetical protein HOP28_11015 [Gemmatimonadales bacterium]|nr:hypothetical protein [Gemmatimonadales bacterium]